MGAYKADTMLAGRANFGFVSKYKKRRCRPARPSSSSRSRSRTSTATTTTGSSSPACAHCKGVAILDEEDGCKFLLTAVDVAPLAKGTPDRRRIKIWHFDADQDAGAVDDDNPIDSSLAGTNIEGTVIGGGSIVIHKERERVPAIAAGAFVDALAQAFAFAGSRRRLKARRADHSTAVCHGRGRVLQGP
jgi:hypothetical protein